MRNFAVGRLKVDWLIVYSIHPAASPPARSAERPEQAGMGGGPGWDFRALLPTRL